MANPKLSNRTYYWYFPVVLVNAPSASVPEGSSDRSVVTKSPEATDGPEASNRASGSNVVTGDQSRKHEVEAASETSTATVDETAADGPFLPFAGAIGPIGLSAGGQGAPFGIGTVPVEGLAFRSRPVESAYGWSWADLPDADSVRAAGSPALNGISEQPTHFTSGIVGPLNVNFLGVSMDFDMTVLWIAAWCRRNEKKRKQLVESLRSLLSTAGFKNDLKEPNKLELWLSHLEFALNSVAGNVPLNDERMSLAQISEIIGNWNHAGRSLVVSGCGDLLASLDGYRDLEVKLVKLLMDEQEGQTIFTDDKDTYPGWVALNLLRYWTILGRNERFQPLEFGPMQSPHCIETRIQDD